MSTPVNPDEELITVAEIADKFHVSVWAVREWIKSGKLNAIRPGKSYLVPRSELVRFANTMYGE